MPVLSAAYMHDEAVTFAHVEAMLWADGPVCPTVVSWIAPIP